MGLARKARRAAQFAQAANDDAISAGARLAEDQAFGMAERWITHGDGTITVARQQLVGAHVDYVTARRNEGLHGPSRDFRLMASIPAVVVEHYCRIRGITLREFNRNREHSKAIVNDPAFADLRVAPGRM